MGLAADEALPVLLDGDHYIPMKTPLRLVKATLSRQLSFVCSSFRPLPIPRCLTKTFYAPFLIDAPTTSARCVPPHELRLTPLAARVIFPIQVTTSS